MTLGPEKPHKAFRAIRQALAVYIPPEQYPNVWSICYLQPQKTENPEDIQQLQQLAYRFAKLLPLVIHLTAGYFLRGFTWHGDLGWVSPLDVQRTNNLYHFSQARRLDEHYEAPNSLRWGRCGSERSPLFWRTFSHSRGGQVMQFIP